VQKDVFSNEIEVIFCVHLSSARIDSCTLADKEVVLLRYSLFYHLYFSTDLDH